MTRAFRILLFLAVGFVVVAVVCAAAMTAMTPAQRFGPPLVGESLAVGLAQLLLGVSLTFGLLCAVAAVCVRGLAWRSTRTRRSAARGRTVSAPREP